MNLVFDLKHMLPFGVAMATEIEHLSAIKIKFCDAIISKLDMPEGMKSWLNKLGAKKFSCGLITLKIKIVSSALQKLYEIIEIPVGIERVWFGADISALAAYFSKIIKSRYIRFWLEVVKTDVCWKFHVDAVQACPICKSKSLGTPIDNFNQDDEIFSVKQLTTGLSMILCGIFWPGNAKDQRLSRSPPIEKLGEEQSLLVLEAIDNPEDES